MNIRAGRQVVKANMHARQFNLSPIVSDQVFATRPTAGPAPRRDRGTRKSSRKGCTQG